jgi:hypothetical protein
MIVFCSFFILLLSIPSLAAPGDRKHDDDHPSHGNCLDDSVVDKILANWIAIHNTDPQTPAYKALVDATVTDDFQLEDETVNFFFFPAMPTGPYITGKPALIAAQTQAWVGLTSTPMDYTPEVAPRHSCDSITFRWISSQTVTKVVSYR